MATVRVMYWKEIPVQVEATDGGERISMPLDGRFQEAADAVAMIDGSAGSDEYLEGWAWSPEYPVDGPPEMAAQATAERFNSGMPKDLVARIRNMIKGGSRSPTPGAIDDWFDG